MAAPDTTPNTPAIGLVFDINPADPVVISVLVGVASFLLVAAMCLRNGSRLSFHTQFDNECGGVGQEEEQQQQQQQQYDGEVSVCRGVFKLCGGGWRQASRACFTRGLYRRGSTLCTGLV